MVRTLPQDRIIVRLVQKEMLFENKKIPHAPGRMHGDLALEMFFDVMLDGNIHQFFVAVDQVLFLQNLHLLPDWSFKVGCESVVFFCERLVFFSLLFNDRPNFFTHYFNPSQQLFKGVAEVLQSLAQTAKESLLSRAAPSNFH